MKHVAESPAEQEAQRRAVHRPPAAEPAATALAEPGARPTRPLSVRNAVLLQRQAGNRATAQLLAQRLVAGRGGPSQDPKFSALKRDVKSKQQTLGKHAPPKTEADAAQGAAKPPPDDKQAQGKAANAEKMNAAKPGDFDKKAFIKAVNDAIAKQAPKNLEEADEFGDSGKAEAVKGEVQGKVGAGKETSAKAIDTATKAPPDTAAAKDKPVTPLRPDQPPPKPGAPSPDQAVPDKAPPAATDFSAGPKQVDQQMADAQVTEEQLAKSNEPEFTGALKEKKEGEQHAATAPGQVRAEEAKTLSGAKAQAAQAGAAAMTTMAADRTKAGQEVGAGKEGAKSEDEKKREQVTAKLQTVFDATKKDVEDILNGLDKKVDDKFSAGEKAARDAFTAEHKRKMDAYKDKRYGGWDGPILWVKDKLAGMPDEVNAFYEQARDGYLKRMQQVISNVADVIGTELNRAKARIATGRDQLQAEVKKLPTDLQALGKEVAGEFASKFDELTQSVDDKGTALVDTLASKYTEALKAVDEEIASEKEKNKGLVAKIVDAVKGVIDTILKLKDMLLSVLATAATAVMAIIKDPIGFLGKLISAVGAGLKAFIANIANHLKKGLVSWLLGAAAKAGLQLPEKFDIKGILALLASLLGLTWAAIRGRVVSKGVPEQAIGAVESSVPVAQKIKNEGIGGVWEQLKEKVGDLKENLLGKIADYLIPTVLIAGITWIVSLLNPASAFIKACKAIIDIVMFIVDRGAQIMTFVNAVLNAVIAIAGGGAGGVPGLIENALALAIPVLIGFLAALLGIGGLADKVKKLFQSLSKPVMQAVDWIVGKIVALGKQIWAKMKAKFAKKDGEGPRASTSKAEQQPEGPISVQRPLTMSGTGHQLRTSWTEGTLSTTLASSKAGSILTIVDKEAVLHRDLAAASPEPEKNRHAAIERELSTLRPRYDTERARIQAQRDKTKIRDDIVALNDDVAKWTMDVASRYGLHDFARDVMNLGPAIDSIRRQIEDQLEKHVKDEPKPENPGDGHANTATAAERYLLWVHHTDQRHIDKTTIARDKITAALAELEEAAKLGLDLSTIPMYERGRRAKADCEKALNDPKGYLAGKPGLEAQFVADIQRQRRHGRAIGASWIT